MIFLSIALNQELQKPNPFILAKLKKLIPIQIDLQKMIYLKMMPTLFMIKSEVLRISCSIKRKSLDSINQTSLHGCGLQRISIKKLTIHLLLKATDVYYPEITKSRSRLNCAKVGLKINIAHMVICVHLPMENMSFKRKSMFHRDTKPNSVSNTMRIIIVHTEIDANSFTPKKLEI